MEGIEIYVFSKKVLPSFLSVGLFTFYITISYTIFRLFRQSLIPVVPGIYIYDAPDTENLLSLVETIYMYRSQKNY